MKHALLLLMFASPLLAANVRDAVEQFQKGSYREAARAFAACESLTPEQTRAWAYCRLRIAAESWNASKGDAATAQSVIREATAALQLAPDHAELRKFAHDLITTAGGKMPEIDRPEPVKSTPTTPGWLALETENFRIRYPAATQKLAETLSTKADAARTAIFTRWSGPPGAVWNPKCEIVLHPSANDFAHATNQPVAATGHALVQLEGGAVKLRRIDLRSDDDTATIDALPRELTHIVLADLFPSTPPPRWAADGMSVLAMSPGMVERYLKTATSLAGKNEWPGSAALVSGQVNDATPRSVGATALVDTLTRINGERAFAIFLRDSQRYGLEKSLDRQFNIASLKALDSVVLKDLRK